MSRDIPTEELISAFSYESINNAIRHKQEIYAGNFFAAQNVQEGSHDYIDFMYTNVKNENAKHSDQENIYITIDDTDKNNMEKAWNAILPLLIKDQVYATRVVREGSRYAHNIALPKCGQQIVLRRYCDYDRSAERWNTLLTKITEELVKAEVKPGPITETSGYEILNAFCLRKKVAMPNSENDLEALNVITVDNQPVPNIISRTQFTETASSLNPCTLRSQGRPTDLRRSLMFGRMVSPRPNSLINSLNEETSSASTGSNPG